MDHKLKTPVTCIKCGKQFDLLQFGYPGDVTRNICWSCKPPTYAKASYHTVDIDYELGYLDHLENKCLRS